MDLKRIQFLGRQVDILLQNENGPCPLLAIANILLLCGYLKIPNSSSVDYYTILHLIQERVLETNGQSEDVQMQKGIQDVMDILPSLTVGLDVNVRFHSITDFEYTKSMAVFDLLDIQLVHGWMVDPSLKDLTNALGDLSYNSVSEHVFEYQTLEMQYASAVEKEVEAVLEYVVQTCIVDKIVAQEQQQEFTCKQPPVEGLGWRVVEQQIAQERTWSMEHTKTWIQQRLKDGPHCAAFLKNTATQLTAYGLQQLKENVRERQLCVFFRNNHFATLFKMDGQLYLLVTDAGYMDVEDVVWEHLTDVSGNTEFVNHEFKSIYDTPSVSPVAKQVSPVKQRLDTKDDSDYKLACRLQEQENATQPPRPPIRRRRRKSSDGCTIQ